MRLRAALIRLRLLDHGPIDKRVLLAQAEKSRTAIWQPASWTRARRYPPPPRPSRLARWLPGGTWTTGQVDSFAFSRKHFPVGISIQLDVQSGRPLREHFLDVGPWSNSIMINSRRLIPEAKTGTSGNDKNRHAICVAGARWQ